MIYRTVPCRTIRQITPRPPPSSAEEGGGGDGGMGVSVKVDQITKTTWKPTALTFFLGSPLAPQLYIPPIPYLPPKPYTIIAVLGPVSKTRRRAHETNECSIPCIIHLRVWFTPLRPEEGPLYLSVWLAGPAGQPRTRTPGIAGPRMYCMSNLKIQEGNGGVS